MTVERHRDHLLNYVVFLRVTPLLPNWFINLASPVIGVPLVPFTVGTFFGVAPPSFVAIQAGQTLQNMSSSSDAWSWHSVIMLGVFALLSMVPVLFKQKLKQKFDQMSRKYFVNRLANCRMDGYLLLFFLNCVCGARDKASSRILRSSTRFPYPMKSNWMYGQQKEVI